MDTPDAAPATVAELLAGFNLSAYAAAFDDEGWDDVQQLLADGDEADEVPPGELGASSLRAAKAEAKADTCAVGATRTRGVGGECSARGGWVVERMGPDAMHKSARRCDATKRRGRGSTAQRSQK